MRKKAPKTHQKDLPEVTVIIPTSLGNEKLISCLESIKKLNYPQQKIKPLVVDNNTPNQLFKIIRKRFKNVTVIRNTTNLGFVKAVNQGFKTTRTDYYFVTNDDIVFEKNSLRLLVELLENNQNIGIGGGKQLSPITKNFVAGGRYFNFFTGMHDNIKGKTKPIPCDQIDGCNMLIKRDVIEKIGYFDEGFSPAYFEDLDFCIRAKKAGFDILYHPKAIFYHYWGHTTSTLSLNEIYFLGFRNKLRLLIKYSSLFQLLIFLPVHYFLILPYRMTFRKEPILKPEIEALIWNIKQLKETLALRWKS